MKILFDENFPSNAKYYMQKMYPQHDYFQSGEGKDFPSMDDPLLFQTAAEQDVDLIITSDIRQIEGEDRANERNACRQAGLHWVGIPQPLKIKGRARVRAQVATLLGTFTYIERHLAQATEPQAVLFVRATAEPPLSPDYPQPL